MATRAALVTGAEATQSDAEVRVVVHGFDIEGGAELVFGRREPSGPEVGASQGLTYRTLLRLEGAGTLQRNDRSVGVVAREKARAVLEGGVGIVVVHLDPRMSRALLFCAGPPHEAPPTLWYNRLAFPMRHPSTPEQPLPAFAPFAGVRYDCRAAGAELEALAAPPYDVIDDDHRAALEAAHPRNSVRLILPRDEDDDGDRYARAAAAFVRWQYEGVLAVDASPRFYAYRMQYAGPHGEARHTRGVIGALTLPERGDESVLPHERTLPKAKSDRLALLRAMRVNVDPIWALTLADSLTEKLDGAVQLCSCTDADGVVHELGAIDDAAAFEEISRVIGGSPLVLADGHHRFETAVAYRDELRASGADVGGANAIMALVVELDEDELCIAPIHRLVELPAGVDVRARLASAFVVTDAGSLTPENVDALEQRMATEHGLGIVDSIGLALAVPRPEVREQALGGEHPAVATTDAALVETLVVPRLPGATWAYRHDAHATAALVEKGAAGAAILCKPVSVAQTRAAAIDRVRMPQKTTFFWPKPRTGMVFRPLD